MLKMSQAHKMQIARSWKNIWEKLLLCACQALAVFPRHSLGVAVRWDAGLHTNLLARPLRCKSSIIHFSTVFQFRQLFRLVFQFVVSLLLNCFHLPLCLTQNLINDGYAVAQLVSQLHDAVVESENYSDKQKSVIVEKLAVSLQPELKHNKTTLISTD